VSLAISGIDAAFGYASRSGGCSDGVSEFLGQALTVNHAAFEARLANCPPYTTPLLRRRKAAKVRS